MIKSILTAAALIGLAVPTASAHTSRTTVVTKRVVPVVAVSQRNTRGIRAVNRRSIVAVTPKVKIVTPVLKIVTTPSRVAVAKKKAVVPVRSTRNFRR